MSASKSDRLGRNPFDRGTYSSPAASKAAKSGAKKSGAKARESSHRAQPAWRIVLNELDRRAPRAIRDLKICKRVAALADLASARLSRFARHLEA